MWNPTWTPMMTPTVYLDSKFAHHHPTQYNSNRNVAFLGPWQKHTSGVHIGVHFWRPLLGPTSAVHASTFAINFCRPLLLSIFGVHFRPPLLVSTSYVHFCHSLGVHAGVHFLHPLFAFIFAVYFCR